MHHAQASLRTCPSCGRGNRVPPAHLADVGRCGACGAPLAALAEALEVDAQQFHAIVSSARVPVLVDFWAPWCAPCRRAAPEVAQAAASLSGQALVLKVNTEEHPQLSQQYGVRSIPNFMIFQNGQPAWQQAGLLNHQQLDSMVRRYT